MCWSSSPNKGLHCWKNNLQIWEECANFSWKKDRHNKGRGMFSEIVIWKSNHVCYIQWTSTFLGDESSWKVNLEFGNKEQRNCISSKSLLILPALLLTTEQYHWLQESAVPARDCLFGHLWVMISNNTEDWKASLSVKKAKPDEDLNSLI